MGVSKRKVPGRMRSYGRGGVASLTELFDMSESSFSLEHKLVKPPLHPKVLHQAKGPMKEHAEKG